jgi:hypothetical protein
MTVLLTGRWGEVRVIFFVTFSITKLPHFGMLFSGPRQHEGIQRNGGGVAIDSNFSAGLMGVCSYVKSLMLLVAGMNFMDKF